MKILVTGASGQLGRGITEIFSKGHDVYGFSKTELDVTDLESFIEKAKAVGPDVVINCAANTHVDSMETIPEQAYAVNAFGARNAAVVAENTGAKIVQISTDYVFDGEGHRDNGRLRPYKEYDHPRPVSVYGKSKLQGEEYVRHLCHRHFIVRTAWLYGEGRNFVTKMIDKMSESDEMMVVNDQWGSPTSVDELVRFLESLIQTQEYGVIHATCEGQCSWYDFAKQITSYFQYKGILKPCSSNDFLSQAKRPHYSVLDNTYLHFRGGYRFKTWEQALEDHLLKHYPR